jgi:hypothetical protein
MAAGFQPTISDGGDRLPDGRRFEDRCRWHAQELLPGAGVVGQGNVADPVEAFEEGKSMVKVIGKFLAAPGFGEQPGGGVGSGPRASGIEDDGLDALASGVGCGLGAEQTATNHQQDGHVFLPRST